MLGVYEALLTKKEVLRSQYIPHYLNQVSG